MHNINEIKKKFLPSHVILRFLITDNEELNNLIIYQPDKFKLITTDQELYESITAIKEEDTFKLAKLKKFMEVVSIYDNNFVMKKPRSKLTEEKLEVIRKEALNSDINK